MERSSGILMPMSALPSRYGIGTMGKEAYRFIDFLKAAGQKYWQLLPLGPTGYGDSPYSSFSSFAGNPYYIDLDMLAEDGLLKESELNSVNWGNNPDSIDYGKLYRHRLNILRLAYKNGFTRYEDEVRLFLADNPWLDDYALFMALKAHFEMKPWTDWEEEIRLRKPDSIKKYSEALSYEIDFYRFTQFLFFRQWNQLRNYAKEHGICFIGDIPIYVALDSADVWSEPQYFKLDSMCQPTVVAGCPPDAFNDDGQRWGNPIYRWDLIASDGFAWWKRRLNGIKELFDVVRIDHFRGIESYWEIPASDNTARYGRWIPGPGIDFVTMLKECYPDIQFIAEDLGYLNEKVKRLVNDSGFPGMKVLEFAFDGHGDSCYLPYLCVENSVCYPGTHDNDTVIGWLSGLSETSKKYAGAYMNITEIEGWCWGIIRTGMSTASKLFVVQMQDVLELGGECRTNYPGTVSGNWCWRMLPDALSDALAIKLKYYTKLYNR